MYKLTLALFSFSSLVLPIVAVPGLASKVDGLEKRTTFTGTGFVFQPGLGACGQSNVATNLVVAVSVDMFNGGASCFQQVQISSAGGSVQAQVVDECFACGTDDLDMSPETFQSLNPAGQDVISEEIAITWNFV